jgi:CubicO group peptidase (beta-lactamase class C family)
MNATRLGFDSDRLQYIDSFIDERYIQTKKFPGFGLLIARSGEVAHKSFQGMANIDAGQEWSEDTIVRLYSMTKPVTSVALLMLYERGLFQLTDPVSRFIPSFKDLKVWEGGTPENYSTKHPEREMQIRDLLTHTSGLTYGFMRNHPIDALYRRRGVEGPGSKRTLKEMVDALATVPLLFSPGTEWAYSVATDVCGYLVEVISGKKLDEFFASEIFEPLKMADASFWVDDQRAHRFAANYVVPSLSPFGVPEGAAGDEAVLLDASGPESAFRSKPTMHSGGGGLTGTIGDYHRFTQMLIQGGTLDGARILGPKTIGYATQNHLPQGKDLAAMGQPIFSETRYDGVGFGLGFSVSIDPAITGVISSGSDYAWGGAASTTFWVDPAEDLAVIGLTQLMPSSAYPIRNELKALVYGAMTD